MYAAAGPFTLGLLIGGMAMFSFIVAPMAFRILPEADAGRFVRGLFPHYYLFVIVASALTVIGTVARGPGQAKVMAVVLALAIVTRQVLMPAINRMRDRQIAGDASASRWFGVLHGTSVAINFLQLGTALVVLVIYVSRL